MFAPESSPGRIFYDTYGEEIIMKKLTALLLAILLLASMSGCILQTPANDLDAAATAAGDNRNLAPNFTVYDADGKPVKLSDFRGKPVVLNFWASWCPPCKSEMPDFQKEFEVQGSQVQFLVVNLTDGSRETVATASAYIAQQGYTFPCFLIRLIRRPMPMESNPSLQPFLLTLRDIWWLRPPELSTGKPCSEGFL